jgi:hypothetical protein
LDKEPDKREAEPDNADVALEGILRIRKRKEYKNQ